MFLQRLLPKLFICTTVYTKINNKSDYSISKTCSHLTLFVLDSQSASVPHRFRAIRWPALDRRQWRRACARLRRTCSSCSACNPLRPARRPPSARARSLSHCARLRRRHSCSCARASASAPRLRRPLPRRTCRPTRRLLQLQLQWPAPPPATRWLSRRLRGPIGSTRCAQRKRVRVRQHLRQRQRPQRRLRLLRPRRRGRGRQRRWGRAASRWSACFASGSPTRTRSIRTRAAAGAHCTRSPRPSALRRSQSARCRPSRGDPSAHLQQLLPRPNAAHPVPFRRHSFIHCISPQTIRLLLLLLLALGADACDLMALLCRFQRTLACSCRLPWPLCSLLRLQTRSPLKLARFVWRMRSNYAPDGIYIYIYIHSLSHTHIHTRV